MKKLLSTIVSAALTLGVLAPAAPAAVNIERQGAENPVIELANSMKYGALGGLLLGSAIALTTEDTANDGDIIRWSFVGGVFLGLGCGIHHIATRPKATSLLEFQKGAPSLHAALPVLEPGRGMTMRLVAVRF